MKTKDKKYNDPNKPFKWKHFLGEIILFAVRQFAKPPLSYKLVRELLLDRELKVNRSTIFRWVQEYANEIYKKVRGLLIPTYDPQKFDEMHIKENGKNYYLYRAINSNGNTIDSCSFLLLILTK